MATFRKIGDRWSAEVYVNGVRKSKRHDTKAQAKNWASQTEFELGQMADGVSTTHMLLDVFKKYAEEISETKKGAQWEIVRLKMFERFSISKVRLGISVVIALFNQLDICTHHNNPHNNARC